MTVGYLRFQNKWPSEGLAAPFFNKSTLTFILVVQPVGRTHLLCLLCQLICWVPKYFFSHCRPLDKSTKSLNFQWSLLSELNTLFGTFLCPLLIRKHASSTLGRRVCCPYLRLNNIADERDIPAAAHDVAKINASQRANVRLARGGGMLRARCVERKQPPPRDAPAAHTLNPKPLFLFPSPHPRPYSCLVRRSFEGCALSLSKVSIFCFF